MLTPDFINGFMEFASAGLTLINVRRLLIDKRVAGVSLVPIIFFDTWGVWNLYYYDFLNQWISLGGGACLLVANVWWTALAFYYGRGKPERSDLEQAIYNINPVDSPFMRQIRPPHADDCDWHFEQYDWECNCGLTGPLAIKPDTVARYEKFKMEQMG